ncbi:MAG TPA: alpha/beta hydrolase [Candidatus Dormibacteraeota bacterium]|nr:alpha/beta hydrolase [Candidatus Dormibacteraeota bacterium]
MKIMRFALLAILGFFAASISFATSASPGAVTEDGQTIDISGGGKLYYHITGGGSGTPLVILNGGPGFDHRHMHIGTAFDTLGKDRRIIFYDQRGNGRSGPLKPGQSCTLADQIEDLEALRTHLKLDKWDVLGHSWGGFLSMAYSARHPEHVAHLIIVDSAAPKFSDTIFLFSQIFPETIERRAAYTFADELGDKAASDAGIREYLTMLFYSAEKRDSFIASIHSDAFTKEVGAAVQRDIARFDLNPELPKFKFPTLVVTGRYDINVAPLVAYKIHQAIPGSKFVVLERSGHIPFYEQPDEFVAAVESFLK